MNKILALTFLAAGRAAGCDSASTGDEQNPDVTVLLEPEEPSSWVGSRILLYGYVVADTQGTRLRVRFRTEDPSVARIDTFWAEKPHPGGTPWTDYVSVTGLGETKIVLEASYDGNVLDATNVRLRVEWMPVLSGAGSTIHSVTAPVQTPQGQLYAAQMVEGDVFTSGDGVTWEPVGRLGQGVHPIKLYASPAREGQLYAETFDKWTSITQYQSSDGGRTWQAMPLPAGEREERIKYTLAVHPSRPQTHNALGYDNNRDPLLRSDDGGVSWTTVYAFPSASDPALYVDPSNPNRLYAKAGGVYRSDDAGQTWALLGSPSTTPPMIGLDYVDAAGNVYVVSPGDNESRLLRSQDQGHSWQEVFRGRFTESYRLSPDVTGQTLALTDGRSFFATSHDDGRTWKQVDFSAFQASQSFGALMLGEAPFEVLFRTSDTLNLYRRIP